MIYHIKVTVDPKRNLRSIEREARILSTRVKFAHSNGSEAEAVLLNDTCSSLNIVGMNLLSKDPGLKERSKDSEGLLKINGVHGSQDTEIKKVNIKLQLNPMVPKVWVEVECHVIPAFKGDILISAPQLKKWGAVIDMSRARSEINYRMLGIKTSVITNGQLRGHEVLTLNAPGFQAYVAALNELDVRSRLRRRLGGGTSWPWTPQSVKAGGRRRKGGYAPTPTLWRPSRGNWGGKSRKGRKINKRSLRKRRTTLLIRKNRLIK